PVVYQCWLDEPNSAERAGPRALFEAACDHVGYVAANLAIRWHPKGDRVLFVKRVTPGRHGLFEVDLAGGTERQVFPYTAEALIFDWTPDGRLCCVLGSTGADRADDGVWLGRPEAADWWHVPHSGRLARAELPSLLEQLRATRPAWTSDGARFAFVTHLPS